MWFHVGSDTVLSIILYYWCQNVNTYTGLVNLLSGVNTYTGLFENDENDTFDTLEIDILRHENDIFDDFVMSGS